MKITKEQARRFLLLHHGLLGEHIYEGKDGVMSFIKHKHCIQYDPVNVCGKTADITLHSRIGGYKKEYLDELLYKDRKLVDYFDKNLCILPIEDFPVFLKKRKDAHADSYEYLGSDVAERIKQTEMHIVQLIEEKGHISSKEIETKESVNWYWGVNTSLARIALETMYFQGKLIIHHKTGTIKHYALTKDHVAAEILNLPMPYNTQEEGLAWHVKRRINSVGILWNKASDAWLAMGIKAAQRADAFHQLIADGQIFEVTIEGVKETVYICESEREIFESSLSKNDYTPRMELIAPLDSFIWDRKLIAALFDFEYKWEIYTPQTKRKYGPYTLPVLYGDMLIGRVDIARKGEELAVNKIWTESGRSLAGQAKADFKKCVKRFAEFNGCSKLCF